MENLAPQKLKWLKKELDIEWKDHHESKFSLLYLRKKCPCAMCRHNQEEDNPLKLFKEEPSSMFEAKKIEPVGHYALKIYWGDGHSSGIYTYEWLRQICPCSLCRQEKL